MKKENKQKLEKLETETLENLPDIPLETPEINEVFRNREINRLAFPETSF